MKLSCRFVLISLFFLLAWLAPVTSALAANEVFLSNDTAESEATYVVQFEATVKGNIDKIKIKLPPGANAGNAVLGRVMVKDKVDEDDGEHKKDVKLSVDPGDSDTLVVDLHDSRSVKPGTEIRVELFNLNNPVAGNNHAIGVSTLDRHGNVLEVIPPIAYATFPIGTGDITAVNTPAGSGLTGSAASGDVNLSLQVCAAGQVLKSLGSSWACAADNDTDTNSGGTVTSVTAGAGLTATPNPITATGTVAIASSFQLPQGCSNGQVAEWSGSAWVCANDDNSGGTVTAVTASAPLASSGGTTPNISLPNVIISAPFPGNANTAIGSNALPGNTGSNNTASGAFALLSNTTGNFNTAIGFRADVSAGNLTNATAIGNGAIVDASNKIRLGNAAVTVVESTGTFTQVSDKTKKENFKTVDGEEVLKKIGGLGLTSWNFIGHDPQQFRHYGPMAQDFFAAFGNNGIGTIGTPTTIGSSDMAGILMIGVQALEKQNRDLKAENAQVKARLDALEQLLKNKPYVTTAWAEPLK